ncbi:DUF4129 domain-containing protein [Auraticoccus monumenti]|uniref:Protein-glutamine gamma-glutamyltransferase-like C-terminal domain-containing protein n=1 Tax=Auraticoccus monumenti TaxID=675864 RepID=A0A1G7E378_9ACTN|nr:DUF4129 domain-containing protein [Auraticoccus monumenti]SDE58102.1 protein of unknown function [Auraticoccus monumenti]
MTPLDVPIEIGRDEARRLAAEELGRARYDLQVPEWLQDLLARAQRALYWLMERLGELVERTLELSPSGGGGGDSSPWLVVGVVLLLVALAVLVWRVGLPRLNRRTEDAEVSTEAEVSAAQYRTLAEQAGAAGDWAGAVLEEFRSLVRELEHLTVIDPRPSRTALEVAWRASLAVPTAEPDLRAAAGVFNDVVYGRTPATPERWQQLRTLADQALAEARTADLSGVPA